MLSLHHWRIRQPPKTLSQKAQVQVFCLEPGSLNLKSSSSRRGMTIQCFTECCCGGKMIQWTRKCLLSSCDDHTHVSLSNNNCRVQPQKQGHPKAGPALVLQTAVPTLDEKEWGSSVSFPSLVPTSQPTYLFSEYFFALLSQSLRCSLLAVLGFLRSRNGKENTTVQG